MNDIKNILYIVIGLITTVGSAQYITIDDTKSAQELIENTLVNSSCASATNFKATGDSFTTGQNSYGYFNAGDSDFPLKEGVILTTSSSKLAIGPYRNTQGNGSISWTGDTDLDQTLGTKSINATVLEFDFIPLTNFISFNYIFASNEYQSSFACNYSDGFAFLIKEAGSSDEYKNIAVIPGTDIPVSSKNVHPKLYSIVNGINQMDCDAMNETYFNGFNTAVSPVNYNGQTIKMTAQSNVIAGKTYHIKLVVADDRDQNYDSAIFLEAGSFSAKVDLGPDLTLTSNNILCYGDNFTIDTKLPASYTYSWFKDGSSIAISDETKPTLTVTEGGNYKVKVAMSTCIAEDEIKIEYAPQIVLNDATLYQCDPDEDGISVFDLTSVEDIIKNNDPKLIKCVYYKSLANAQNEINPIENPSSYTSSVSNETLYARVSNAFGCVDYAVLNLVISDNPIGTQHPIEICDLDELQDGITQFDLNVQITSQLMNGLPLGLTAEYYLTPSDAVLKKNQLPNLFTNTVPNQQIIYARIVNGPDCYKIIPETLVVNTFDPPNFQDEITILCDGTNKDLTVDSGFSSYLWNTGVTTNTINVTKAGEYIIAVTNSEGCQKIKKFIVKSSNIGTITNVAVSDFSGPENSITISYSGNGDYEFSLDGKIYQDSPIFNNLNPEIYWATIRDKNGCGTSLPYEIYVLDYPRFFTPNNDGNNDTWMIKNTHLLGRFEAFIFDRFGKLLKQINQNHIEWDGKYNGKTLSSDDYWFTLVYDENKRVNGHFSLKR